MEIDDEFPIKSDFLETVNVNYYNTGENRNDTRNSLTDVDALLSELSSKYATKEKTVLKNNKNLQVEKSKPTKSVTISDSESEDDLSKKYLNTNAGPSKISKFVSVSDSEDEIDKTQAKKSPKKLGIPQKLSKEEKEAAKKAVQEEKRVQRELKKAENLKAKEIKKKLNQASKNLKPEEYLKLIEVFICDLLSDKALSKEIFNLFNESDIKYSKNSQIYPSSITWKRTLQSHVFVGEELKSTNNSEDCENILFILECNDLIALIESDELIEHFKTAQEILPGKIITLGLFGINEYFRTSKNQQKRSFKNNVLGKNSKEKEFQKIDRNIIETNLTKLQVFLSICYKYLDTAHDLAALVHQMTKAIAKIPYKQKKLEQIEQADNYMIGDNKDCVVVDKNGNGLSRLWQQNITSFPIARLDLSESIMAQYPTINSLMQAYEKCADDTAGEKLLENFEIRRAAGPLTNFRRVGPEFSKKMFKYYNSRDPDMFL